MNVGDKVRLKDNPTVEGTVSKLPTNSAKRKRPRVALVDDHGAEIWLYLDEVEPAPEKDQ